MAVFECQANEIARLAAFLENRQIGLLDYCKIE